MAASDETRTTLAGRAEASSRSVAQHGLLESLVAHSGRLTTYIRRFVGDHHAAEDVVAEALVVAVRRREELPDDLDRALGWLYATARNQARNHARGEFRRHNLHERATRQAAAQANADVQDHHSALDRVVMLDAWDELSDADREVLGLAAAGRSYATIADAIGVSSAGVGMRIMRARQRLAVGVDEC